MRKIKYGMAMLLALKEAALSAEVGSTTERVLLQATNCGMFALASNVDDILKYLLDFQTNLANYKYQYALSHHAENQWNDLGFFENPEDMTEEQRKELRELAKKFYPEDGEEE